MKRRGSLSKAVDNVLECKKQNEQPNRNAKQASDWIGYLLVATPVILVFRMEAVVEKYSRY